MRGNRSDLTPGRKSLRCHVNTPLEEGENLPVSSCTGILIVKDRELKSKLGLLSIESN